MGIKGTRTEKNLLTAFAGESQARNRYTYFASAATKEGRAQIAAIYEAPATQHNDHAQPTCKLPAAAEAEPEPPSGDEIPAGHRRGQR